MGLAMARRTSDTLAALTLSRRAVSRTPRPSTNAARIRPTLNGLVKGQPRRLPRLCRHHAILLACHAARQRVEAGSLLTAFGTTNALVLVNGHNGPPKTGSRLLQSLESAVTRLARSSFQRVQSCARIKDRFGVTFCGDCGGGR